MGEFALPDRIASSTGIVDRDGVRLAYAVSGSGPVTILLLPTWSIIRSQFWKLQVPYLARHYRVVTFDGRGSGESGRPSGAAAYTNAEYAADALAVLDATGTDRAVVVGLSAAAWGVHLAADHPDRVSGLLALGPACGFDIPAPRDAYWWGDRVDTTRGWAKYNKYYWLEGDYDDFARFFFSELFTEPRSTKQIEDCVAWAHEIAPSTLADTTAGRLGVDGAVCERIEPFCERVQCPVLVIHGTDDHIRPHAYGERLAELTGGRAAPRRGAPATGSCRATRSSSTRWFEASSTGCTPRSGRQARRGRGLAGGHCGRSTCLHPSASATPAATSPSPPSCANGIRTCRSTGWPSTPSRESWRPLASGSIRLRGGWPTSRPTSRANAASTTSTRFRRSAGWTPSS
jgi:pimeloyl-ACP methyl ester carboxylesterase